METSTLHPVFLSRSFGNLAQPGMKLQVEKMSWEVEGGCKSARLTARIKSKLDLDLFTGLLRCPVVIYSGSGRAVWWGLVWSVRVQDGRTGVWTSLDDLSNRVRTIYGQFEPEATGAGVRQSTGWADDLRSQAAFGVKEGQFSMSLANITQAEAYRAANLAKFSQVQPRPTVGVGADEMLITVDLRGWWETLGWRYYSNTTGIIQHRTRNPNYLIDVGTTANQYVAQQITIPVGGWRIESIWYQMKKVGLPTSTVTAILRSDSGGSPGSILGAGTLAGAAFPISNPAWVRFVLATPVAVSAGNYWIDITDDSTKADANYYRIQGDRFAGYAGGGAMRYGGSWVAIVPDLQFQVAGTMESTEQIRLMAGAAAGGQFLAGVRVDQASGLYTNPQRSGDTTALEEITAQLEAGTAAGEKLQAAVTAERYLIVSKRPAAESAYWMVRNDGIIRLRGGQIAQPGPDLAGSWAVLDTAWSLSSANWMLAPGRGFIERVEWQDGVCRARVRGATAAAQEWQLSQPERGG